LTGDEQRKERVMGWTTPRTWVVGELVTKTMLDTHLRDNLMALKDPPSAHVVRDNAGVYTTNSGTLVPVDDVNFKATLTTFGGDVLVWFVGTFNASSGTNVVLDIRVDGTDRLGAGFEGLLVQSLGTSKTVIAIPPLIVTGLDAGEHSFELLWRSTGVTIRLFSDTTSGTNLDNLPAILAAREVS
jgi:hypothetical protein